MTQGDTGQHHGRAESERRGQTDRSPEQKPATDRVNHGQITVKIQERTHVLICRLVSVEAERAAKACSCDPSCDDCVDEWKKRIPMTDIIHRAIVDRCKKMGVPV